MYKQGINNLDEQLKLNTERDKLAKQYVQDVMNRIPAPPIQFGHGRTWLPEDALGLQDID